MSIPCRTAACREGGDWIFYLLNDSSDPIDAWLYQVGYEWGDQGSTEKADVRVVALAPGQHARFWRDDGSGAELRMELRMRVRAGGTEADLRFEFPKLYRMTDLPVVDGLGRPGYVGAASQ